MEVTLQKQKEIVAVLLIVYDQFNKFLEMARLSQIKTSRPWTRFIYSENERQLYGFFEKLFVVIKSEGHDEFRKATRMGVSEFSLLNRLLHEKLKKQDFIRQSIVPECRLAITLVFLAHGVCRQMLAWSFRVGVSTIAEIILETCEAIWDELAGIYLAQPNVSEWLDISNGFYQKTAMPHVVGAIDGKHIEIKCPPKSGSLYFNYKQYFSIVLLAACDSNYSFTAVDIGAYGSQSDGGILQASGFGNAILQGTVNLPSPIPLPNTNHPFPFYFVADAAFPLKNNIMRPYPGRLLTPDKENFNKMLSRARVRIENTFGVATAKWRVITGVLNVHPKNAEKIVKAIVVLHNFVKLHDMANYCPPSYVDQYSALDVLESRGGWRQEVNPLRQSRLFTRFHPPRCAFLLRDELKNFLFSTNQ